MDSVERLSVDASICRDMPEQRALRGGQEEWLYYLSCVADFDITVLLVINSTTSSSTNYFQTMATDKGLEASFLESLVVLNTRTLSSLLLNMKVTQEGFPGLKVGQIST